MFLNLHIHTGRATHEDEKLNLIIELQYTLE